MLPPKRRSDADTLTGCLIAWFVICAAVYMTVAVLVIILLIKVIGAL